jgi:hypothetical protein
VQRIICICLLKLCTADQADSPLGSRESAENHQIYEQRNDGVCDSSQALQVMECTASRSMPQRSTPLTILKPRVTTPFLIRNNVNLIEDSTRSQKALSAPYKHERLAAACT